MPMRPSTDGNGREPTFAFAMAAGSRTTPVCFGGRRADALDGLTIVLPCFDEAENLAEAVRCATGAAERCALTHEIVIVDDGSTDQTTAVAGGLAGRDGRV